MKAILKSKKLSSWLSILGLLVFIVPFFQILGVMMLGSGLAINFNSDRSKSQKMLWTIPSVLCILIVVIVLATSKYFNH